MRSYAGIDLDTLIAEQLAKHGLRATPRVMELIGETLQDYIEAHPAQDVEDMSRLDLFGAAFERIDQDDPLTAAIQHVAERIVQANRAVEISNEHLGLHPAYFDKSDAFEVAFARREPIEMLREPDPEAEDVVGKPGDYFAEAFVLNGGETSQEVSGAT
jgi:hypothetical protein